MQDESSQATDTQPQNSSVPLSFFRRKYLISPRFQWEVTGFFLAILTIVFSLLYFVVYRSLHAISNFCQSLGSPLDHTKCNLVVNEMLHITKVAFAVDFVIAAVFLVLGGILMTHRIAGPIHRLSAYLKDAATGSEPGPVALRKFDQFHGFAKLLREALMAQRKK